MVTTEIAIGNPGAVERRLELGHQLTRQEDGTRIPVAWEWIDSAAGTETVPAGGRVHLRMSATLDRPGAYQTEIAVFEVGPSPAQAEWRLVLLAERAVSPLPASFVLSPRPAAITLSPWGEAGVDSIGLTLRNGSDEAVEFEAPTVISTARVESEAESAMSFDERPQVDGSGCPSPLAPGNACQVDLKFPSLPGPGEYAIGVGMSGVGGNWAEATQTVRVRASWLWAFVVIVAGVGVGWYVNTWRNRGRPTVQALINLARIADRLKAVSATVSEEDIAVGLARLEARVQAIEQRTREAGADTAELSRLEVRTLQFEEATGPWNAFLKLPREGRRILQARFDAMHGHLDQPFTSDPDLASFRSAVRLLGRDLKAWPSFWAAEADELRLAAALDALAAAEEDSSASSELSETIRTGLDQTVPTAALSPDNADETVANLTDRLTDLAEAHRRSATAIARESLAKLRSALAARKLVELAKEAERLPISGNDPVGELTAVANLWMRLRAAQQPANDILAGTQSIDIPGLPPIDLPIGFTLPREGTPLSSLLKHFRRNELISNGIIAGLAGLAGVATLWASDPTWGSFGSILTAFIAGTATRIVVGDAASI